MSDMTVPLSGFVIVAIYPGIAPTVVSNGHIYPTVADAKRDAEKFIFMEDILSGYQRRDYSYSIAKIGADSSSGHGED